METTGVIEADPRAGERLIERFMPEADVRERHEVIVRAPAELVFEVAEGFDLLSIPSIHAIFWLRAKLLGAPPPERDDLRGLVDATRRMGWQELGRRPGRELVMGAATQPWLPSPVFEPIPPDRFRDSTPPERVKIAWTLEVEPLGLSLTRLRTETRVVPTDDEARRRFRRYWYLVGAGILLIRRLALPAMRREAERRAATSPSPRAAPWLEHHMPHFDVTLARERVVAAPAAVTFGAIGEANLLDPVVSALFAVREAPARALARMRGEARERTPRRMTLDDLLQPGRGMVRVAELPGEEIVVGSVGRFWEGAYGHRDVAPEAFDAFSEPGYAKLAMDLWVRPLDETRSLLRYEARTVTTDREARRRFRRYWRVIRPGVWLVMGRALALIAAEAERRTR